MHALDIAWEAQIASNGGGRSMWGDLNVVIDAMETWDRKNNWGGDFDPKNSNTGHTGLVLVWGWSGGWGWPVLNVWGADMAVEGAGDK